MEPNNTLGKILTGKEQRDAVHVAILPVQSSEDYLHPGDKIGFVFGSTTLVKSKGYDDNPTGIVDPFLKDVVSKGQWFWMWLMPNTVTGMRHHWQHPAVDQPTPAPTNDSELWLRKFADKWEFDYDEMIKQAQYRDGYITANGIDLHGSYDLDPGDEQLFWQHIERLTGFKANDEHRELFCWSCSC